MILILILNIFVHFYFFETIEEFNKSKVDLLLFKGNQGLLRLWCFKMFFMFFLIENKKSKKKRMS